jgi:hypothetical protein
VQSLKVGPIVNLTIPYKNTLPGTNIGSGENIVINKMQIDNRWYAKMGLDQYAYVAAKAGAMNDYYEHDDHAPEASKPREIAYWRKHPNLQGWMRRLWESRGNSGGFNGDELELTWADLDSLELAVTHGQLPGTTGFFFGENADAHYRESDLEFVKNARAELFLGLKVFYNSSW